MLYENTTTSSVLAANFISRKFLIVMNFLAVTVQWFARKFFFNRAREPEMHILFHALSCTHKRKLKEKEFCCRKYFATSNSLGVEPGT